MMCNPHYFSFSGRAEIASYLSAKPISTVRAGSPARADSTIYPAFGVSFWNAYASGARPRRSDGEEC